MTHLEKMERLVPITFKEGEWTVIRGLLCGAWGEAKETNRAKVYIDNLEAMFRKIDRETDSYRVPRDASMAGRGEPS